MQWHCNARGWQAPLLSGAMRTRYSGREGWVGPVGLSHTPRPPAPARSRPVGHHRGAPPSLWGRLARACGRRPLRARSTTPAQRERYVCEHVRAGTTGAAVATVDAFAAFAAAATAAAAAAAAASLIPAATLAPAFSLALTSPRFRQISIVNPSNETQRGEQQQYGRWD